MREMGQLLMPSSAVVHERAEACAALLENRQLVNMGRRGNLHCRQFARDPRTGIILTSMFNLLLPSLSKTRSSPYHFELTYLEGKI